MSSTLPEKEMYMYSEEVINLTKRVKEYAQSYTPWEDAGADLVGIIPAERLDTIPKYSIEWMNEYTIKTTDQMEDAKSIIVLGYHASDDIYEVILRKGNKMEPYEFIQSGINQRRTVRYSKTRLQCCSSQ
jgi:hypothetical protein